MGLSYQLSKRTLITYKANMSSTRGVTVKDVSAEAFIKTYAAHLKRSGELNLPAWVDIVKTAHFKELAPYDEDWFYIRTASIARKVYLRKNIGVGSFRRLYGGAINRGHCPSRFAKASGHIPRAALKELQRLKIVEVDEKNGGRRITNKGQRDLDRIAGQALAAQRK